MWLGAGLFILIGVTHYSYDLLALLYENQEQAAKAIFYILRGNEGAVLFVIIGLLKRHPLVHVACLFGLFEESQTSICRLSKPIAEKQAYELFQGICGYDWKWAGAAIALILVFVALDLGRKK